MICDVHAHCLPQRAQRFLEEHYDLQVIPPALVPAGTPLDDSAADVAARLAMMGTAGVGRQVLSLPPVPLLGDEQDTVRLAQVTNDAHAQLVADHPGTFQAYIHLPLPYLDASLTELDRCRHELGLEAVSLFASHGSTAAVAPEFDALFEKLNEAPTVVFFHPRVSGLCSPLVNDYGLTAPLGPILEDVVLVSQIVVRQFPVRFPELRIVIPHLGGALPIYVERMDNQVRRILPPGAEAPSAIVRRLWYDTLVHGSVSALRSACRVFDPGHIVPGSDYPALEHFGGYASSFDSIVGSGLPADVIEQILHHNAGRLFDLQLDT